MRAFTSTRQIFSACNKILTPLEVGKIFKIGARSAYRWAANPDYANDVCRNPLDNIIDTFEAVLEMGRDDIVEGALSYICEKLGYKVCPDCDAVKSDKNSASKELLDVNTALGDVSSKLQKALVDDVITAEERTELVESAASLIRETMELKAALECGMQ